MIDFANAKASKNSEADDAADLHDREFLRRGLRFSPDQFCQDHASDAWCQRVPDNEERRSLQAGMPQGVWID